MPELSPDNAPRFAFCVCASDAERQAAMAIRLLVFVGEQQVPPELEADEYDADALHLLATETATGEAVGAARILDRGDGRAKIGRVAVKKEWRGCGIGRLLMEDALRRIAERGFTTVFLEAQVQVIPFYERLGFVAEGPVFQDAGIDHRKMTRKI